MIRHYFKIILQNFFRNKAFSLINILGLSTGLAVCLIIFQYVRFERSYDDFHDHVENKYRVVLGVTYSTGSVEWDAANYAPVGSSLVNDFPEVKNFVRISPEYSRVVLNFNDESFEEQKVYYADSSMFSFFNYELIEGDPTTALNETNTVVLSLSTAEKLFGPKNTWVESPLRKTIYINNKVPLAISGIMEDFPENSHFHANVLVSFLTFLQYNDPLDNWDWNDFYTYIELVPGADYKAFESKLPAFLQKYKEENNLDQMVLQPVGDIHLHSNVGFELNNNGSAQSVYFLSVIALLILIIAWVNYINLATSKAESRAKEIGVRKVNGAGRGNLILQFLLESFFMNLLAMILASLIVYASLPFLEQLLGKKLVFSFFSDYILSLYIILIYFIGSFLSGIYPALVLSSLKPSSVFKASSKSSFSGTFTLRKGLVIFQFIMSAGLITGTIIIENQMRFIRTAEMGFSYDKTFVLNAPSTLTNDSLFFIKYQNFKQSLLDYTAIDNLSVSSALPGKSHNDLDMAGGLRMAGDDEQVNHTLTSFRIDENFCDVFNLNIIAGKNFSFSNLNKNAVLLNQKATEILGYHNPEDIVGKKMNYWGQEKEIIGVIENYHHKSLKDQIEPMIMRGDIGNMLYITVQLSTGNSGNFEELLKNVQAHWVSNFNSDPFNFFFLDEHVNNQYQADIRFSRVFTIFSGFSILIACLGLFGLVSYSVSARIKEIGIRKVLGASISSIVLLFSKSYLKLMVIAFIVGIPLAHYILNMWLENFAFKASVGWQPFVFPACIVSVLVTITVSMQIIKAAIANPVKSLRSE